MKHTTTDIVPSDWTLYREESTKDLALKLAKLRHPDARMIIQQVEAWQRLRKKVPFWAETRGLIYPVRLSVEQCSGEEAAWYKGKVVMRLLPNERGAMVDLTGGMGVDFSYLAPLFAQATYVERNEALCFAAQHNFPILGLNGAKVVCDEAERFLERMTEKVDLIFLDPARRDTAGRKTVCIADCTPDVCVLASQLLAKANRVLIKLSPMLDIHDAIARMKAVREVHVVAVGGECKELLLVLSSEGNKHQALSVRNAPSPIIYIKEGNEHFHFTFEEEKEAVIAHTSILSTFLFEPGAAVMKAGAFKTTAQRYHIGKLHPASHLYTGEEPVKNFPGRTFRIVEMYGFDKVNLKSLRKRYPKANLSIRNFPSTTDALRKKLKIKEGGNYYIFATTLADETHKLIVCEKK